MNSREERSARLEELRRIFRSLRGAELLSLLNNLRRRPGRRFHEGWNSALSRFQYFELAIRTSFVEPTRDEAYAFMRRYADAIHHPAFPDFLARGQCEEVARLLLPAQQAEIAREWNVIPDSDVIRILRPDNSLEFAAFLDLHYAQLDLPIPLWQVPRHVDSLEDAADVFYLGPSGRFYEWNQIQGHAALYAVISGVIDYGLFFRNLDTWDRRAFAAPIAYWLPDVVELGRKLLPDDDSPDREAAWPWHTETGAEFPDSTRKAFERSHKTLEQVASRDMGPGFDPSPGRGDDDPDESISISLAP